MGKIVDSFAERRSVLGFLTRLGHDWKNGVSRRRPIVDVHFVDEVERQVPQRLELDAEQLLDPLPDEKRGRAAELFLVIERYLRIKRSIRWNVCR